MSQVELKGRGFTIWEVGPEDFRQEFRRRSERIMVPTDSGNRQNPQWLTLTGTVGHGHQERLASEPPRYGCLYIELSPGKHPLTIEVINEVVPLENVRYREVNWPGSEKIFLGVPSEFTKAIAYAVAGVLGCGLSDPVTSVRATIRFGAYHMPDSSNRVFDSIARDIIFCCLREARIMGGMFTWLSL